MSENTAKRGSGWARLGWVAVGLVGGLMLGGASVWAVGQDETPGFGHFGHRMHFMHRGPVDPEAAREHVQIGVRWALKYVDGTPEQEEQVQAIARGALDDLLALRGQHQANREAIRAALSASKVDREALEQARRAELKLADQASQRLLKAVADAADALTPEQRAQLADAAAKFRH